MMQNVSDNLDHFFLGWVANWPLIFFFVRSDPLKGQSRSVMEKESEVSNQ